MKMNPFWAAALTAASLFSTAEAATTALRILTQDNYLPGLPVLVRVEGLTPSGTKDRETWESVATLSADGGVSLSTNQVNLHNGAGSVLVTFSGGGDFNLTASVGGVQAQRTLHSVAGAPVTLMGGTLSGGSGTWSGIINVTSDVIVTNYTLTIQSNTLVLLNGVGSGTVGVDLLVNTGGSIQSLGTELHPVTITCASPAQTNRWGQIRHNSSQPSLYRHTFIHRAGRAPGEGHTSQAAAIRTAGSALNFESATISDLCETSPTAQGFGTPAKVMFAVTSALTFDDCLFQRVRTGPEIEQTSLLYSNSYVMETRGPDDSDGFYIHAQQGGQTVKITDSVFALGDDDGIDTLGPIMSIERCLFRGWNNLNEDAKGVSVFDGTTDVRDSVFTDCTVALAAKTTSSVRVNVNGSTFAGNLTNLMAAYKANAPGPNVELRITNSIVWGGNPVHSDFDEATNPNNSTNFIIRYSDLSENWIGTGNLNIDPLFVNAAGRDFRLQPGSPAINAGNPNSALEADGSRADMGAFPFLSNPDPLVAWGANWRFLDDGSDQGTNWAQRAFDDGTWSSGPAQLGYGDGDEATLVGFGGNTANKFITTYFRRNFSVLNPSEFTNMQAQLLVDDGAVVYLNGQELFRVNLPGGPVNSLTLASTSNEGLYITNDFSPSLLLIGTNVISVEVHQQAATSSDISFDFGLVGHRVSLGATPPSVVITAPPSGAGYVAPADVAITMTASDADGTVTNLQLFQNGTLLWQTAAAPYNYTWSAVPNGSYLLTAVATDDAGLSTTSAPVLITVTSASSSVTNSFVNTGSVWRYFDLGQDLGTAWTAPGFNDATWAFGPAQLGYGEGDEATTVGYGGNLQNVYITTYFRQAFTVTNAAAFTNLSLRLLRDDGGIAYLNGVEIFRTPNMPAGTINYQTTTLAGQNGENTIDTATINSALPLLVEGTNVLAVEIHQAAVTSSDLSFDFSLTGVRPGDTNAKPIVSISAPANGALFGAPADVLIQAAAFDPDGTVTNVDFYANGVLQGQVTLDPFTYTASAVPAGSYALRAVATDNVGQSATSAVVNITISTNIAPPVIAAKSPVPGNATNLTSITVTFSKVVTGVSAADLLINGSPATGVSGSGSNYTFTFPQPSFGPVAITWGLGHGIADTFIPSHPFDTNSPNANWNYQLLDSVAPTITTINPVPNATVPSLSSISITFSEPVTGVNAADLLINAAPAISLTGTGAGPYAFGFATPAQGLVQIAWAGGHGIIDSSGNAFAPAPWSYTLDTNSVGIVISEIMYHPSSENPLEEYIELHNKGGGLVDLTGWRLDRGVSFTFSNAAIPAAGYLVVAANTNAFMAKYPGITNVVGDWLGTLNNTGEELRLINAQGQSVDALRYADNGDFATRQRGPSDGGFRGWIWSKPHDGLGSSLELLNPQLPNDGGQNWAASRVIDGTPGRANSVATNNLPPLILDLTHFPVIPRSTNQVVVSARLLDEAAGGFAVTLNYRVSSAAPPAFTNMAMRDDGLLGDVVANDGLWSARLPAFANNAIVEFFVSATDAQGLTRNYPGPAIPAPDGAGPTGQVVNALFQVDDSIFSPTNAQPLYKLIMTVNEAAELASIPASSSAQGPNARMNGTWVSLDGLGAESRYNVAFRNRGHGSRRANPPNYRVDFRSDDLWKGRRGLNLNSVSVHLQHVGSVLSRLAGAVSADTIAVQLRVNNVNRASAGGGMFGSYAAVEAIESDWAENHFPNDDGGNIYKVVRDIGPPNFNYRGPVHTSYTNTYFKESNASENDWSDLIGMLEVMGENSGALFTPENVRRVLNPEQWLRHMAVMNLFANGESGLNSGNNDDYYMYRGVADPRFILTAHDLDSILGGGFGATHDIFRATCCPISGDSEGTWRTMDRFMRSSDFQPIYYQTLYEILTGPFAATNFDAVVNQTLGGYVSVGTMDAIKSWMNTRRAYVLGQIPVAALANLAPPTAVVSGTPRSPTPVNSATLIISGSGVATYQYSLNGEGYSAEVPITTPLQLTALPAGLTTVSVLARGTNGVLQPLTNATVVSWSVNPAIPSVRLNEILAQNNAALNHQGTFPDAIELYNEGSTTVNLGGLRLTDDNANPNKFTFPVNTLLPAGSYLTVYANNPDGTAGLHLGFSLDAAGDSVHLFDSVANGGARLDSVKFGRQLGDYSIGRHGGGGEWYLGVPTLGASNVLASLGPVRNVRLNEWLAASLIQPDFVELHNPGPLPVDLGGVCLTDSLIGDPARNRLDSLNFLGAGEFLALIADGNGNGRDKLNFSLASEQGELGLLSPDRTVIDSLIYGPQQPEVTQGKCPNGTSAAFVTLTTPTPGAPNACPFTPPPPVTISLLTISNNWAYFAHTNLDGVNWTTNTYNDSAWTNGLGLLGQLTPTRPQTLPEPIRTVIVTNASNPTYYARAHFTVAPGTTYTSLQMRHIVDDGAAFYLNGVEIPGSRFNLPAGALLGATLASGTVNDAAYSTFLTVPNTMLIPGDNVLAVEVHQSVAISSDTAMGVELQALIVTNSPVLAGVVINEVLANNASLEEPDGSKPDWIELYNPSSNAVDLADMSLTDDTVNSRRWVFPASSILAAQGYLKVRFDAGLPASATNTGFGLKANGGSIYLFNKLAEGGSVLSSVTYGLQAADFSIGRVPDGGTNWVLTVPSLGGLNLAATLGNASLLKINEWMADPASGADYIEVFNPNPQPVDISRFYLTDDLNNRTKHQLPALSYLGQGQDAFQKFDADGNTTLGADHLNFSLRASGEAAAISAANGTLIDGISFGPQSVGVSQGRLPDGAGTIVNFATTPTPGKSNFMPLPTVVVNEVIAHTDAPLEDAVEFFNPTTDEVNISGWYLSDSQNNLLKYRIPTNTVIPAGGYAVVYEYQFNPEPGPLSFSFSSAKGDEVYLSESVTPGVLTGYRAYATFGASENGVSFGRFPTSQGVDFTAMSARTFGVDNPVSTNQFRLGTGLTNAYPKVGPVVINEIMYHPVSTNEVYEFIELRNITASAVALYDTANPSNTWRVRKGVDYNFPPGVSIPAGGYLVLVSFDPATDPAALALFTTAYGTNLTLAGPYSGKLDNASEPLELQKPDAPQTVPGPDFGFVPYVVVDRVVYADTAPWPITPDGLGDALKKYDSSLYGNEPLNWQGGAPTPGAANFAVLTNRPPVLSSLADRSVYRGGTVSFTAGATDPDLPGQSLTFSLEAGAPAGATIHPSSGLFTWTPVGNQGAGAYPITVRVSDNGSPSLSDTKSFTITLLNLPVVTAPSIVNGNLSVSVASFPGRRYRLETTPSLTPAAWVQVGNDIFATGNTTTFSLPGGTEQHRFYRVLSVD